MPSSDSYFASIVPGLAGPDAFELRSPKDGVYNCIAFAAGDTTRWWWPEHRSGYYWPPNAPMVQTIPAFVQAFESVDYVTCDSEHRDAGYEKIAIFAIGDLPRHAARQEIGSTRWLSKMGSLEDIVHNQLEAVSGEKYDEPVQFMRRRIRTTEGG